MYLLVVYDITEDDVRNKVAEVLRSFGLERIRRVVRGANADVAVFKVDRRAVETAVRIGGAPLAGGNVQLH